MKPNLGGLIAAIAVLVLAGSACTAQVQASMPALPAVPTAAEAPLLSDNFSNVGSGWDIAANQDSSVAYENGGLRMRTFKPSYFTGSNPGSVAYENVHVDVTARNLDGNPHTSFGILCDEQPSAGSYYYFAITPGGQYEIVKSVMGQQSVSLTGGGDWAQTDLIARNAASYRLGADCGTGRLTLYVDGRVIDSVRDSAYIKGEVGLFLLSGQAAVGDVLYDDFVVTRIK